MSRAVHLKVLEVSVRIDAVGPEAEALHAAVLAAWDRCLDRSPGPEPDVALGLGVFPKTPEPPVDEPGLVAAPTLEAAMELLTQHVTVEAIARRAGELLMLHACALADPVSGRSVVMVGPSGMGKTTLARTLGRDWGYVTDETAGVAASGELLAYPKPLSVVSGTPNKTQSSPSSLGLRRAPEGPLKPELIALLDRQSSLRSVAVQEIATVEAVALLAEHTSFLTALPKPLTRVAEVVDAAGGLVRVSYSEAAQLGDLVREAIG